MQQATVCSNVSSRVSRIVRAWASRGIYVRVYLTINLERYVSCVPYIKLNDKWGIVYDSDLFFMS